VVTAAVPLEEAAAWLGRWTGRLRRPWGPPTGAAVIPTANAPAGEPISISRLHAGESQNADVEAQGDPEPVVAFKTAIHTIDALLIATPEYNHGVPRVLKNGGDWASRPHRTSVLDCNRGR